MITTVMLDWKQISEESISELREALAPFGVKIYDDPRFEGSDTHGLIFSDSFMSKKAIARFAEEN